MDEGPRFFTLEEANALLPAIELALGDLARLRVELEQTIRAMGGAETAVAVLQEGEPPPTGKEPEAAAMEKKADLVLSKPVRMSDLKNYVAEFLKPKA